MRGGRVPRRGQRGLGGAPHRHRPGQVRLEHRRQQLPAGDATIIPPSVYEAIPFLALRSALSYGARVSMQAVLFEL